MHIGINAEKANDAHSGIGQYATNLLASLSRTKHPHRIYAYFYHETPKTTALIKQLKESGIICRVLGKRYRKNTSRIFWEQFVLPKMGREDGIDVFHYLDHAQSLFHNYCPTVITVHDLCFYRQAKMTSPGRRYYKKLITPPSIKRAARIITPSQSTKQDIIELLQGDPNIIDVVSYGINPRFSPIDNRKQLERFRTLRGLPQKFLLYVGAIEPRKNLIQLLRAFKDSYPEHHVPLVMCGSRGWQAEKLDEAITVLGLSANVMMIGPLNNEVLPMLYNLATAVVYPSTCEGFGLPPVEAMACGVPVIISNRGSLPEISAGAAFVVDYQNLTNFSLAITKILSDKELRNTFAINGLSRACDFSWNMAVVNTLSSYERMIE